MRLCPRPDARAFDLRQQVCRPLDRAGDKLREETDEDREVEEVTSRAQLTAVDANRVRQLLERVERDADREHQRERRQRHVQAERGEDRLHAVREEVEVLEGSEKAQIGRDRCTEQPALDPWPLLHRASRPVVHDRRRGDEIQEPRVNPAVEHVACDEQQDVLRAVRQPPVHDRRDEEEDDEVEAVKDHRRACTLGQNMSV